MSEEISRQTYTVQKIYNEIRKQHPIPHNVCEYGVYMRDIVSKCVDVASKQGHSGPATGNMSGRWFEMICKEVFEKEIGMENITMYVMDGKSHKINEIDGLEAAQIPYPDAIIKNEREFKAMISIKWGNRHDRLYEIPHSGNTINDFLKLQNKLQIHVYFLTNDDSASRLSHLLNDPDVTAVYHLVPDSITTTDSEVLKTLRRLKGIPELINELKIITCMNPSSN